jgi:formylglycine-generating enzyme required for sulfatase activity
VDEITGLTWLVSMNPNKAVTWSQASTGCQDLSYAGFNDWRLPSAREFNTIVDYRTGRVFEALFGEDNAGSIEVAWTASACGDQASAFDPTGGNQTLGHSAITYKYLYRCVRGEWKGTTVASSSTAVDNRTDLEWTATPQAPGMDWVTALAYCESLVLDGKDDWRLPNIREVMDAGYAGILQQPSAVSNGYWSSSPMPSGVSVWVARRDKCFPETYSESPGETTRQGTVCVRSTCGFSCGDNRCRSGFCTCAEECAGKPCGDAACGPACGQCRAGFFCQDGACPKAGRYVLVGHGAFSMGSATNEVCRDLDEPQHAVTITRDLLVKETVVTQGEWKAVFGNNPSSASNCGDDCPVERVNWFEAVAYCNELSKKAGLQECYSLTNCDGTPGNVMTCSPDVVFAGLECTGFRLPTESEWEYFARAGSVTTYPNGGSSVATDLSDCGGCLNETGLNAIAWYCHNAGDKVHPVAKKTPNDWGVFDCLGNVQQWCSDWMGDYPGSATDPTGPAGGTNRVIRGGAYFDDVRNRSASRFSTSPSDALFHVGFRPVRTW